MSFDVFLQRFVEGDSAAVDKGPVRDVLKTATRTGPDEFGWYVLRFPDGVETDFSASGLESQEPFDGCAFHIRGIGDHLIEFIFNVAQAGDMVVIPAMEDTPIVLVSDSQEAGMPPDLLECLRAILVRSASELGAVLTGGFDGWRAYRDRVVRQLTEDGEA